MSGAQSPDLSGTARDGRIVGVFADCLTSFRTVTSPALQLQKTVITMASKTKIILSQSKHLFQHLLRHFHQAIQLAKSGEFLQPPDIFRLLDSMGYLCHEKTEKDYELIGCLTFMLAFPRGQGTVSQRNLFQFLTIINSLNGNVDSHFETNVQALPNDAGLLEEPLVQISIGSFDEGGKWRVSKQEEKTVREVFNSMIYTRVSRQDISTIKKREDECPRTEVFKPKILNKSSVIAGNRFKRLKMEERVEDRLLQSKELNHSKLEVEVKASLQKQLRECSFRPKINSSKKLDKEVPPFSKEDLLLMKGQEYEQKRKLNQSYFQDYRTNLELSECSFQPNLSSSSTSLRHSLRRQFQPQIRNEEKSIERMKLGREERESLNEINKRGYPQGKSWVHFMEEVRTKRCNTHISSHNVSAQSASSEKPTIFTMDLKILGEQKHLQVREADDILEMTQRICKNHNMNCDNYQKVYSMIEKTLRQSGEAVIKNGRVFLLRRK